MASAKMATDDFFEFVNGDFGKVMIELEKTMGNSKKSWKIRKSNGKFEKVMGNSKMSWTNRKVVEISKTKSWKFGKVMETSKKS